MTRRKVFHSLHQVAVLDDGQRDAGDVGFLEGVGADEVRAHLTRDGHHRHAVQIGVRDARGEVGGAGTGRGDAHPHLARGPRVAVGRVGGPLLVAGKDVIEVEVVEGVVERDDAPARIAEDHVHAFALQRF